MVMNETSENDYGKHYSEESFWEKLGHYALQAGCEVVKKALTLYYCMLDKDTPAHIRATIVGALGYFIFPLDAIPDPTPVVGYADDLGALALVLLIAAAHVKDEHMSQARETLRRWFGSKCDEAGGVTESPTT
jgi:uncharacterized membrane protein YkvA (DUF1232 family)